MAASEALGEVGEVREGRRDRWAVGWVRSVTTETRSSEGSARLKELWSGGDPRWTGGGQGGFFKGQGIQSEAGLGGELALGMLGGRSARGGSSGITLRVAFFSINIIITHVSPRPPDSK